HVGYRCSTAKPPRKTSLFMRARKPRSWRRSRSCLKPASAARLHRMAAISSSKASTAARGRCSCICKGAVRGARRPPSHCAMASRTCCATTFPRCRASKQCERVGVLVKFYSQVGQDRFLLEHFFRGQRGGVFVDIGAYDGETFSN